ncbi:MAG: hypothetical protein H6Q05_3068 [Acidobacteria bacterium]|jgi:hypothetical protein|nr:hypothetical protein [Acidobacteriota bacterium]
MSVASIKALKLAPLDVPDVAIARAKSVGGEPAAVINAGSIVAFAAGITSQEQEDVLYSMQLAQRAASGVADRYTAIRDWYKKYVEVLQDTGWVMGGFSPNAQRVDESEFEMAKAALKIMLAAMTGPGTAVLTAAITALEGMAKEDGFITLFEHFGAEGQVGNFQMGAVEKGAAGELSVVVGAFQMLMTENQKKFLFFKWRDKNVSVWGDSTKATFNRAHYAGLRDTVREMLGVHAQKAIAQLPLKF